MLPGFSFYNSTPPHVLDSFPLPLSLLAASHSHFLCYFFVSHIFSLTCSLFPPTSQCFLSPQSVLSLPSGDPLFCFCLLFSSFFEIRSGLTLQWHHWCLQTSTYSCLLSFHPIIFMASESTCTDSIAMTQTGKPGPSSQETLFLTG